MSKLVRVEGVVGVAGNIGEEIERELRNAENALSDAPAVTTPKPDDKAIVPVDSLVRRRKWTMPMGPAAILAGGSATLQVQPQSVFRVERVMFAGDLRDVKLINVFVGQRQQMGFDRGRGIALEQWTNQSLDWEEIYGRKLDIIPVGVPLSMIFANDSDEERKVDVLLVGGTLL